MGKHKVKPQHKWYGIGCCDVYDSIQKYRMAFKIAERADNEFDCYLPDPDYDDCCIKVRVNEIALKQQLRNQPDIYNFCRELGVFVNELFMMPIEEKMPLICEHYDIIALLQLNEYPEPIPIADIYIPNQRYIPSMLLWGDFEDE